MTNTLIYLLCVSFPAPGTRGSARKQTDIQKTEQFMPRDWLIGLLHRGLRGVGIVVQSLNRVEPSWWGLRIHKIKVTHCGSIRGRLAILRSEGWGRKRWCQRQETAGTVGLVLFLSENIKNKTNQEDCWKITPTFLPLPSHWILTEDAQSESASGQERMENRVDGKGWNGEPLSTHSGNSKER